MPDSPSKDEYLMAALAHAAVVIFGPGILVGVLIWLTQKEKAVFAARQGMQAAVFQLIGTFVVMMLWVLWGIFYALTFIPMMKNPEQFEAAPPPIFWIGLASMAIPLFAMLVWMLYGLWGALKTFRGQDFRYILIGRLLEAK